MVLIPWSSLPDFHSVYSVCSVVDHRANFLPRNTRTTRKKKRGPPWSSFPGLHSLVSIPCVQCVPWLTTEPIFYHGILGPHGKRELVLPSPHTLVFISVYSVCSVVTFLDLGLRRHPSRIGYAQFVVRISGHNKQQVAQTVQENHDVRYIAHTSVVSEPDDFTFDTTADGAC